MMDLQEARISLEFYADSLDLYCRQYGFAVSLTEAEKKTREVEPKATDLIDRAVVELKRVQKEALVLRILIGEAAAKEAESLICLPKELTNLVEAQNRITLVSERVRNLLREHDRKEAEKNAPEKENATVVAIREFLEKRRLESPTRTVSRSDRQPEEPGTTSP
jgi:hypothetical protein